MNTENVTLYFREGSSDRAYQACLEESGSGWVVSFAYGRRGAAISTGTKTKEPIAYAKAQGSLRQARKGKNGQGLYAGRNRHPTSQPAGKKEARGLSLVPGVAIAPRHLLFSVPSHLIKAPLGASFPSPVW
jgi:bifunctional non-homologous end joining protein LigD